MSFKIINKDITDLKVGAIVNAANTSLKMGGGVCGAIFRNADPIKLQEECNRLAPIETSQAVITDAYDLKSDYIIHTAGPIYDKENPRESKKLLKKSFLNSLNLAKEKSIDSIAFPLISAGIYGYPQNEAIKVAKESIESFLLENDMEVYLTIIDQDLYELAESI